VTPIWHYPNGDLDLAFEVKPGSFGLSRIGGLLGKLIAAGQAFSGDGSRFTHAFVVLDHGEVIEAMPGGARIVPIADRLKHDEVVFCDAPVQGYLAASRWQDERNQRVIEKAVRWDIVRHARALEGTGYGYLQYLALGLVALGFQPKWLERYIADTGRMVCSQLVDEVYRRAGIHLFVDETPERLPQQVTPGDLDDYRVRALQRQATR
jgi:hypothetical protein